MDIFFRATTKATRYHILSSIAPVLPPWLLRKWVLQTRLKSKKSKSVFVRNKKPPLFYGKARMGLRTKCNGFYPLFVFLLCITYCSSFPTRPTHVVLKTMTVIEKQSCFVLPTSTVLPPCDSRKKRHAQLEQSWTNWGTWDSRENHQLRFGHQPFSPLQHEMPDSDEDYPPDDSETFLDPSIAPTNSHIGGTPIFWNIGAQQKREPSAVTVRSTVFITKSASNTQRFVPDCMDPDETYEPLCLPKPIKKDWGYHGLHTPDKWSEVDITCASGEEESPVEISTNETIFASFQNLELDGFDSTPKEFLVENNGHTLVISLRDSPKPVARKGGLRSEYEFTQMHFHWGETSEDGSEHVVNGKRYAMEIHMVHYNKKYGSLGKAVAHRDGLEVLAIFVEISEESNPAFDPLISITDELVQPNTSKILPGESFTLGDFLPNTEEFFRYHGSLTTPNCNQAVYWTVFSDTLKISEDQIESFRKLLDHDHEAISGNYRPLQKLFGREIFKSFG